MSKRVVFLFGLIALVVVAGVAIVFPAIPNAGMRHVSEQQALSAAATPNAMGCVHDAGNVLFCVTNYGMIGSEDGSVPECETGLPAESFEFPAGSDVDYLYFGGIWIGAIVDGDTLVSIGVDGWQYINELWPCEAPDCGIEKRSTDSASAYFHPDAVSDLDMIAEFTDTLTDPAWVAPDWDGSPHSPLNIEILRQSYSWGEAGNDEYVLMDYEIRTLGSTPIPDAYIGIYLDGDVYHAAEPMGYGDDVSGHRVTYPEALDGDSIRFAWIADNDGDPHSGTFDFASATGVLGVAFLGPTEWLDSYSFNWWQSNGNPGFDWGPWLQSNSYFDFLTGGLGTPEGNRGKYFMLSNGEIDYDQYEAAVDHTSEGWLASPPFGAAISGGGDTRFLLSFGPVDIVPDDPIKFAIAIAGGHDFHVGPEDFETLFDPYDPSVFEATLDFASLEQNLVAARLMYDSINVGDVNWDGVVDIDDAIELINYVFLSGDEPRYMPVNDLNCDGKRDLLDIVILVNHIFRGGALPGAGC